MVKRKVEVQTDLPGMEDKPLKDLEAAAMEYVRIRDERMSLTEEEVTLKNSLLQAMKRHGKETYRRDGIEIKVVHEEETVKVRVKKEKEGE